MEEKRDSEPPDEIVMQPALYFPPNIEHNSPLQILHKNQIQIQVIALFPVNTVFVPEEEKNWWRGVYWKMSSLRSMIFKTLKHTLS